MSGQALVAILLTFVAAATADEPLTSGRRPGEAVPSFYCRAVTGPLSNRSVCYVCRNGERPVVMILARRLSPELEPLLRSVDRLVDEHRGQGLRSFAVLISDDPSESVPDVQTFAFDHKIEMPLATAPAAVAAENSLNLHADAVVTVVLYRRQRVVGSYALRDGEITEQALAEIADRAAEFAGDEDRPLESSDH